MDDIVGGNELGSDLDMTSETIKAIVGKWLPGNDEPTPDVTGTTKMVLNMTAATADPVAAQKAFMRQLLLAANGML